MVEGVSGERFIVDGEAMVLVFLFCLLEGVRTKDCSIERVP